MTRAPESDDCGLCVVFWVAVLAIPGVLVWAKLFEWAVWLAFLGMEW